MGGRQKMVLNVSLIGLELICKVESSMYEMCVKVIIEDLMEEISEQMLTLFEDQEVRNRWRTCLETKSIGTLSVGDSVVDSMTAVVSTTGA